MRIQETEPELGVVALDAEIVNRVSEDGQRVGLAQRRRDRAE